MPRRSRAEPRGRPDAPVGADEDFEPFRRVMIEAHRRYPLRILAYCILSNRWHFVVWPRAEGRRPGHGLCPLVGAHARDALEGGTPDVNGRRGTGSLCCSRTGLILTRCAERAPGRRRACASG